MIQIFEYGQVDRERIFARVTPEMNVEAIVSQIIRDVRKGKDKAVIEYCRRFDRVDLRSLEVTREEIEEAKTLVSSAFLEILKKAAVNIRAYHEKQVCKGFQMEKEGIILGQKVTDIILRQLAAGKQTSYFICELLRLFGTSCAVLLRSLSNEHTIRTQKLIHGNIKCLCQLLRCIQARTRGSAFVSLYGTGGNTGNLCKLLLRHIIFFSQPF